MSEMTLDQFFLEAVALCELNVRKMHDLMERARKAELDDEAMTVLMNVASMRASVRLAEEMQSKSQKSGSSTAH